MTALLHGTAVAVFRTDDDEVYAVGNHDPSTRTGVLAKGIVGAVGDVPYVASPTRRRRFDLRTGRCLDAPALSVPSYPVRVVDGIVLVGPRSVAHDA